MNVLFFLTPKVSCAHLCSDESVREALERMELSGYSAIPVLGPDGTYLCTVTEGDMLRTLKNACNFDLKTAEQMNILEVVPRRPVSAVRVTTQIRDLLDLTMDQNFVPVVDDRDLFIGIVTRKSVLSYFRSIHPDT